MMMALPPGFSTRCISFRAFRGSEKFLNAARQTIRSNKPSSRGMSEALPWMKRATTPSRFAYWDAIVTKDWLISSPVILKGPSFARAMERYPGPGAISSTRAFPGRSFANSRARRSNSPKSFRVILAYQVASPPSIEIPRYGFLADACIVISPFIFLGGLQIEPAPDRLATNGFLSFFDFYELPRSPFVSCGRPLLRPEAACAFP